METTFNIGQKSGWDVVQIVGPINEETEVQLTQLGAKLGKQVVFNFKQVSAINSLGVRAWVNFIRVVAAERTLVFEECSPEIVNQINMIPNFKANAQIRSVYGTFFCGSCSHQQNELFEAGKTLPKGGDIKLPPVKCQKCGSAMEFEEVEDAFFAFAKAS